MIVVPKQATLMVGTWVWWNGEPHRIEHVRTWVAGKLPNGKDDVRHEVLLLNGYWHVTHFSSRVPVYSTRPGGDDDKPALLLDRATEEQQAAFESAYALIPLSTTIAQFLSAQGTDAGAGPVLTDDILGDITKLENKLRAALRRRQVGGA